MKSCASRRESMALLASGLCPRDEAADLENHLRSCSSCREYFRQLSAVCDEHSTAAAELPEVHVPSRLFHRVATRIRSASPVPQPKVPQWAFLRRGRIVGWAALLVALGVPTIHLYQRSKESTASHLTQSPQPAPATRVGTTQAAPNNLLAYRHALNRSPEALEELLSEEAAKPTPALNIALRAGTDLVELEL